MLPLALARKAPQAPRKPTKEAIGLPREIYDEILSHLRHDFATNPTLTANSGLQIILSCRWLYEELKPDIEAYYMNTLVTALDTRLPSPCNAPALLQLFGKVGLATKFLSSSEFVAFLDSSKSTDAVEIEVIRLELPLLRSSDTDIIWAVLNLVTKFPRSSFRPPTPFRLTLSAVHAVVEHDSDKRIRWARALFRLLDVITSWNGVILHLVFNPSKRRPTRTTGIISTDSAPESLTLSRNEIPRTKEREKPPSGGFFSGLRDVIPLIPSPKQGLSVLEINGPLSSPVFQPYANHILQQSYTRHIDLRDCSVDQAAWDAVFGGIAHHPLPSIMTLKRVNISLPVLIALLERHPTVDNLSVAQSHGTEKGPYQPRESPHDLRLRILNGDPHFLKALFAAKIRLPSLVELAIDCRFEEVSKFDDTYPGSWNDLALLLGQIGQKQINPRCLKLTVPQSRGMNQWMAEAQLGDSPSSTPLPTAAPTTLGPFTHTPIIALPPTLRQCLQNLRSVNELSLYCYARRPDRGQTTAPIRADPALVVAFIAALPSVERVSMTARFTESESSTGRGDVMAVWDALGTVWSMSRTLKWLSVDDSGDVYRAVQPWTRGSERPYLG